MSPNRLLSAISFCRLHGLNGLLIVALLTQLLSGCPPQSLELWCPRWPEFCCRTVVRRGRRPSWKAPFHHKLVWLMCWLAHTSPHWLLRCGLLLGVLWWKRAVYSPLAWGLLLGPLLEMLGLGLGLICSSSRWRRRYGVLAYCLGRSYSGVLLLLIALSVEQSTPLLLGSLVFPGLQERTATGQLELETEAADRLRWLDFHPELVLMDPPVEETLPQFIAETSANPSDDQPATVVWPQLVQDQEGLRLLVQGVQILQLPLSDTTGRRWLVQQLLGAGWLSPEEAAACLGRSRRTVQRDQAAYQEEQDSACLVDRRRFGLGQRVAYRTSEHESELIGQWVLNLLSGDSNSGRQLERQLGNVLDDRTIDRALERRGLREIEATGLRQRVQNYVEAIRQAAYWAGVEGKPLEQVTVSLPEQHWQKQSIDRATASLSLWRLAVNGAYEAAHGLLGKRKGRISAVRAWHNLLTYLVVSGGARLSQAKHCSWTTLQALLGGRLLGNSASFLRKWVLEVSEKSRQQVTVERSDGRKEQMTHLRVYQEESVAQRVRRGLLQAEAIWLDCYVNEVSRRERIARAWHGTKHWAVKAFRRNIAQDVETGHAVTCPLSASDVTPLQVLQQVVDIIDGGLDRAGAAYRLARVTADRWWSVAEVLARCLDEGLGLLCWTKAVKTVLEALEAIDEQNPNWQEITKEVLDPESGQLKDDVTGYRLETDLTVYDLPKPVRAIVDWDGEPGGRKIVRLAVGVAETTLDTETACDELRFRQRVEILLKMLQRRQQWANFGGGEALKRPDERVCPNDEQHLKKLETQRKTTTTRLRKAEARLEQVENELERLMADEKNRPQNSLKLGKQDLRSLGKRLRKQIERAKVRLQELGARIAWGKGQGPAPEQEPTFELDLTREAILTQLKLDIFTANETLLDEFIELALEPVLREEAERQAAERRQRNQRSRAKGQEEDPLCTDVETLYQRKVANLERETILKRLLNQPGHYLYHRGERILITVAQRFSDRRMQAAYERYCVIVNQKQVRVPVDEGEEWLFLFTYEKEPPAGDKFK